MPLSIQLGGFFSASPSRPDEYSIPTKKACKDPSSVSVCGHARMVMYISAEGRALPCMALSGMDIQEKFPLITECGLEECLSDSFYINFLETRASEVLKHNPECQVCEYASSCLGGCRASALEGSPHDLLSPDRAACVLFKEGWVERIPRLISKIKGN